MATELTERQVIDSTECPRCKMEPGARCVYVAPPANHLHWPSMQRQLARVGYPTKRIHTHRWEAARERIWYRARAKHARAQPRRVVPSSELRAAVQAGQAWDRREYLQLALWFRAYGSIFTDRPGGTA